MPRPHLGQYTPVSFLCSSSSGPPEWKAMTIIKALLYWLLPFDFAHSALLLPSHLSSDLTAAKSSQQALLAGKPHPRHSHL